MSLYPRSYRTLLPHWLRRIGFSLLGVVLLYAPFALLTRALIWLTGTPLLPDAHRICMRMPIQWLGQPWMYATIIQEPLYLGSVFVLPAIALFVGPLFCGWLCPAGGLTEYLSRLVPPRFQIDLAGKLNPTPVRYGFTIGMIGASFIGANVCCSFCNFTYTQNLISAVFGDFTGIAYWASFMFVGFVLWFFVLGLFTKGGRGWCNLLCPAGGLQGFTHSLGRWLRLGRSVQIDAARCKSCKKCALICPTWAISRRDDVTQINLHACNVCLDCAKACEQQAIGYWPNKREIAHVEAIEQANI
jgi:ferredoxin-type protein NapH